MTLRVCDKFGTPLATDFRDATYGELQVWCSVAVQETYMQRRNGKGFWLALAIGLMVVPAKAAASEQPIGAKVEMSGVVVERNGDSFLLQNLAGVETQVRISPTTEVKEKKKNFFRSAINYSADDIVSGLRVEVEGRWGSTGAIEAKEVRFTQDDLKVARVVDSRMEPVETRLSSMENETGRISGQVEELGIASKQNREDARRARDVADKAMANADDAHRRIDEAESQIGAIDRRIDDLANYEEADTAVAFFKAGSSKLTPEAMQSLDSLASQVGNHRAYLLEVLGFASADGNEALNRRLSEKRAEAVVRYLTETKSIPLRYFVTPHGFGENRPVADNKTHEGRTQNRRVEVKLLVNRALDQQNQSQAATPQRAKRVAAEAGGGR